MGYMAIASLRPFRDVLGARLEVNNPEFCFMILIAMLCGFATGDPVNRWLIKGGVNWKM